MEKNGQECKTPERQANAKAEQTRDLPVLSPLTDIYETPEAVIVLTEMPGVEQKSISITFENDVLTITGTTRRDDPEGCELLHRGRRSGIYSREFRVLVDVDSSQISAKSLNGVLRVVLPKDERVKPKRIEIQAT